MTLAVLVDQHSQVGDVLASIRFSSDEEFVLGVFGVELEEIQEGVVSIIGCDCIVVLEGGVQVVGVAHSCRRLQEDEVGDQVPTVRIGNQLVSQFVVHAVFQVVGSYFLQISLVVELVPRRDEQPGPPLSQRVTGSLLPLPLADSTKT